MAHRIGAATIAGNGMARIRTVKPEFFLHEGLFDLEQETGLPVQLGFLGLWCQADREGRFRWEPRKLKSQVLPYHAHIDFAELLDALAGAGFLIKYEIDDRLYGCIPSWGNHQCINVREAASTIPAPDATCVTVHARARVSCNIPRQVRLKILARDGNRCLECGATGDLTIDHILPRCEGGDHSEENLRTLCRQCNSARPVQGAALAADIARARTGQARVEGKGKEGKGKEGKGKEQIPPKVPQGGRTASGKKRHPAFQEFWKAYPRKTGPDAAYRAWKRAGKRIRVEHDLETEGAIARMLEAAQAFAESDLGQDKKFCPHASTWLNGGRYDDDRAEWVRVEESARPGTKDYSLTDFLDGDA